MQQGDTYLVGKKTICTDTGFTEKVMPGRKTALAWTRYSAPALKLVNRADCNNFQAFAVSLRVRNSCRRFQLLGPRHWCETGHESEELFSF